MLYQTDNPMVPFIAQSLEEIIRQFTSALILSEKLKAAKSLVSLSKIDFKDGSCHKMAADVSLWIPIKVQLSDLKKRGKISNTQILKFKSDVVSFLSSLCAHLVAKSPIKYPLTRAAHYFIPYLLEAKKTSENRFTYLLEILFKSEHTSGKIVEDAKWEFTKFLQDIVAVHKEEFLAFDIKDQRFDVFYFSYLERRPSLSNLTEVLKMTCLTGKRLSNVGSALTNPYWLRIFTKKVWRHSTLFMIIWKSMIWKLTRSPFHLHCTTVWNRQGRSRVFFLNRRKRLKKQKTQEKGL